MNFEYFIAKRIIDNKTYKSSVSAPIIKIGIAAIAIGIVVMLVSIATGIGLQHKIRDKVSAFNGHLIISNFDSNNSQESGAPVSMEQDFYPDFKSVSGIRHIQAVATKLGVIRTETDFEAVIVKGVGGDYDWQYFNEFLVAGSLPDYSGDMSEDVLISQHLAKRMHFKVGDKFITMFRREDDLNKPPRMISYNIVGIYNSGFTDFDKTYMIGDLRHLQRINKWDKNQAGNFEIFLDDYSLLDEKLVEVYQNTPSKLNSYSVEEKYASIFEWIKIFENNIYGIIGVMILVAGINMITALLVLILERTRMIGILKALGSNNWKIRKIFLYNASYLILLGLFWGNLIGLGLLLAQKYFKFIPLNSSVYYVTEVPIYLSVNYVLLLNAGTFIMCLIMLLVPSYLISKIAPVKAIRFE
ncbi:transmembrane permease [Mangrovimonas yunxiaonensis]|uniref:Transmembrane permease n=1 Tax=Mangrovimonas yunxiaonensis TaxID=1197477 RepID=A0A084TNS7_9FLAO|nr:FtsX-like permease family protein [Mangrovimonas yunxiaonensis]KFB02363.1 transmembrane permease [Mangrovimonas yunxiaonensis]GGH39890.1 permease [Mangrovimonas yunxiaonensis]